MTHTLSQHVALEVRAEMARKRVTQRELAEHLRLSQPQVMKRLNGAIEFRPSELEAAAQMLGVPVTAFLPSADTAPPGTPPPSRPPQSPRPATGPGRDPKPADPKPTRTGAAA